MNAPNPRRRGRPKTNAGDQRERLLDAAVTLFSEQGIAATPLNAITRYAKVTPALLHYYFGNKPQLVRAVVEERVLARLKPVAETAGQLDHELPPREAIATFTRHFIATVASISWLPQLWVKEVFATNGQLREVLLDELAPPLTLGLRRLVERGQAEGSINSNVDARLVPVSLIGLSVFALATRPLWSRLPECGDIDTRALTDHVLALLDAGLGVDHASA